MSPTPLSGSAASPARQNGRVPSNNGNGQAQRPAQSLGGQPLNGNGGGNGNNGGNGANAQASSPQPTFDKPVIFRQSSLWSKLIMMGIIGVTTFSVGWACFAKFEEAVPAQGKLEPQGAVKEVRAPLGGVVTAIEVEEGERVKKGQVLIRFDQTTARAQLDSLSEVRAALVAETNYYKSTLKGQIASLPADYTVPAELVSLTENRAALLAENELFRAQLDGVSSVVGLDAIQLNRLQASNAERISRENAAVHTISQQERQLAQVETRINNTQQLITNAQSQLSNAESQLASAEASLEIDIDILEDIKPLEDDGGIARIQLRRQEQEVGGGEARVEQQKAELMSRKAELANQASELEQLKQERERLVLAVAQAQEELFNTQARSRQEPLTRMGENDKRIAEIDSQLNKAIVENEKQINEIDSQISQTLVTLDYQELKAPVDGTVFDLQPTSEGFVSNSSEPILSIVPEEGLVAQVFITNGDIGFVNECLEPNDIETCMEVDVRIDSFPSSEFGHVEGRLVEIGDDALPPDQLFNFYRFPAKVLLDKQTIDVNGKPVPLQSGMSLNVNIKTRPRRVITYFTDLFERKKNNFQNR